VRTLTRKNKTGQAVRYLQLAHNEWDPHAGASRTKVLSSFGREDELDRPAVQRLVTALTKLLDPESAAALSGPADLTLTDSRPIGGAHTLDAPCGTASASTPRSARHWPADAATPTGSNGPCSR
jgi:hypothetical protein